MSVQVLNGLGPEIAATSAIAPSAASAGTQTSAAIDRLANGVKLDSCVLLAESGAIAGAPSTQTVDTKLQHCDTSGGSYADYTPDGTAASGATGQITAANKRARKSIDLRGAKQYLKVVQVVAFSGGTSPTIGTAAQVIFGAADTLPAESDGVA